jgi:phage replication O-like protein O
MASPQLEKGYTKIANEILEKLAFAGINGSEYRILITVIRKTYGFNKKKDYISLTQFQKATIMDRKQAVETIKSLVGKRILLKEESTYTFNKNWEEWVVGKRPQADGTIKPELNNKCAICKFDKVLETHHIVQKNEGGTDDFGNLINLCPTCHSLADRKEITKEQLFRIKNASGQKTTTTKPSGQKHTGGSGQLPPKSSGQKHTHKRKKEIETKETTEQSSGNGINKIIFLFKEVNPSFKLFYSRPPQRSAVERMLETHGEDLLTRVISYLPKSNSMAFLPTITTPIKLEERWADLEAGLKKIKNKELSNSRGLEV